MRYEYDAVCPQLSTEFDRNALLTLENYGSYKQPFFFWRFIG